MDICFWWLGESQALPLDFDREIWHTAQHVQTDTGKNGEDADTFVPVDEHAVSLFASV
jgi:hypothetical protein